MEQRDKVKLLSLSLEAEVNRRVSVSLFDRFGPESVLFETQFSRTRLSERSVAEERRRSATRNAIRAATARLADHRQELHELRGFDKRAASRALSLADQVRELRDEVLDEIQTLEDSAEGDYIPINHGESTEDAVLTWRLANAPRASTRPVQ